MIHFNRLTFNYNTKEMDSWCNIIAGKDDPEMYNLGEQLDQLQDQIERTDICHYSFPDNIERGIAGIGSLTPAKDFHGCGSIIYISLKINKLL